MAQDAANKALELDPRNVFALSTLANIELSVNYNTEAATRFLERALTISPTDDAALRTAASIAMVIGDFETAMALANRLALVDPLSTASFLIYGYSASFAGAYDDAIKAFENIIDLNPEGAGQHYYVASVLLAQGKNEMALKRIQQETVDGFRYTLLSMVHYALGDMPASDAALHALNRLDIEWAYQRAVFYAARGEKDKAFEWFDKAIEIRDRSLNLTVGDPMLDSLRDDPRFADVLKRLNRTAIR